MSFDAMFHRPPRGKKPEFSMGNHLAWLCPVHGVVLYNEGDLDYHQGEIDERDYPMKMVFVDIDTGDVFGVFETPLGWKANPANYIGHILHWQEAKIPFLGSR